MPTVPHHTSELLSHQPPRPPPPNFAYKLLDDSIVKFCWWEVQRGGGSESAVVVGVSGNDMKNGTCEKVCTSHAAILHSELGLCKYFNSIKLAHPID